ncbi:MAG: hypothetical protein EXR00_08095 [Alphaproteobacteria bacterium]|nr:hypothetical protein [Alphaproteobacteria bacterium]
MKFYVAAQKFLEPKQAVAITGYHCRSFLFPNNGLCGWQAWPLAAASPRHRYASGIVLKVSARRFAANV